MTGRSRIDSASPVPLAEDETVPVDLPRVQRSERYREVGPVAFGGSGEVIECVDQRLGRRVAIKAARRDLALDSEVESMLDRELHLTSGLEHPNIIPVYDAGVDSRGGRYYVMRLVSHPSLAVVLARMAAGNLAALAAYRLGRRLRDFLHICRAVEYAHSRGILHCDLKPANVLLGNHGEVWVVDWGLALDQSSPPRFGGGTPGYMAPEQLDPRSAADARTDVFGLGAILYEMIALRPAFDGATSDQAAAASREHAAGRAPAPPPSLMVPAGSIAPAVAAELDAICARALAAAPADRFDSAAELARALEDLLDASLA